MFSGQSMHFDAILRCLQITRLPIEMSGGLGGSASIVVVCVVCGAPSIGYPLGTLEVVLH